MNKTFHLLPMLMAVLLMGTASTCMDEYDATHSMHLTALGYQEYPLDYWELEFQEACHDDTCTVNHQPIQVTTANLTIAWDGTYHTSWQQLHDIESHLNKSHYDHASQKVVKNTFRVVNEAKMRELFIGIKDQTYINQIMLHVVDIK